MLRPSQLRVVLAACAVLLAMPCAAQTSNPASNPASIPAGAIDPLPPAAAAAKKAPAAVSAKVAREADDAYLEGAKEVQRKNTVAAEKDFARAVQLNPYDRDYLLALIMAREAHLNELVQAAAKARLLGDAAKAESLLEQARAIDPNNPTVAQHFATAATEMAKAPPPPPVGATLAPAIHLEPTPGVHDFHLSGDPQSAIRGVYAAFGIKVTFDTSYANSMPVQIDLKGATFEDATRVVGMMTHSFAVPVQPKLALVAKDSQEVRDALMPLVEETIYLPGLGQDQMMELANVARTVFDVKQVTASATGGFMLLRGEEQVLDQVNAIYADMLDGGSEVMLDVSLYEIDRTHENNIGVSTPTSANLFSFEAEAAKLVAANQSTINAVLASGQITLTGNSTYNTFLEAEYLLLYGGVTDANFTNLLGTIGSISGVPIAGIALTGTTNFNLLLNITDTRLLDALQIRSSNRQPVSFRVGSRYPIVTSSYSNGLSSLTAAQAALLKQYTNLSSLSSLSTPPQVQFEDLGITLKMTPQIERTDDVQVAVDMKIEALAGSAVNGNPVLNNRAMTSSVTVPKGNTAMLAMLVDTNDLGSFSGLPGLNDLPGFQGTQQDLQKNTSELLIAITPHIVRNGSLKITSRRLAAVRSGSGASSQ